MRRIVTIGLAIAAATILALVGLFLAANQQSAGTSTPTTLPAAITSAPAAATTVPAQLSADQAGAAVLARDPAAVVSGVPTLTTYQGRPAYEVPLANGIALVDAQTGAVLVLPGAAPGQHGTAGDGGEDDDEEQRDDD